MPRYLVERVFPERWAISLTSYVGEARKASICVYDGPTPEAIRRAAKRNGLPVDRIIQVTVLDPYFYR
jgi:hypothetical protein